MTTPTLPPEPWRPAVPALRSSPTDRSPDRYLAVARQFDVEHVPRYQPGGGKTYCNCYLWDCTSAMGAEIPHWVDLAGEPAAVGHGAELSANATVAWLDKHGAAHGWSEVDEAAARAHANTGAPAVAVWVNPLPGHSGHVAMVIPNDQHPPEVTVIAQAGAHNYASTPLARGFGSIKPRFFVHA
jgi:hypothetical protein